MLTARRAAVVAVLVACVVVAGLVRVVQIRIVDGHWALQPSASPTQLMFNGRDYHRSRAASRAADNMPAGEALLGHAAGGVLYGSQSSSSDRTVLFLVQGDHVTEYSLAGGP